MYGMSHQYSQSVSYSPSRHGSPLEYIAHSEVASFSDRASYALPPPPVTVTYGPSIGSLSSIQPPKYFASVSHSSSFSAGGYSSSPSSRYQFLNLQREYHFSPELFLKPGKEGMFVGQAEEIKPFIEEAFEAIFHLPFPEDIKISICSEQEFRKIAPNPGTIGLSINRRQQGLLSEIFVLNDSLARVMLTIGHELGHVLTSTLSDPHDEEAKAYAFSLAWMKKVQEGNIAGLGDSFVTEHPAQNGLHNIAFGFVSRLLQQGQQAWKVYLNLVERMIRVNVDRFPAL